MTVIRNCPQFLHRIPGVQESLLDTLPSIIPITGIAGIAMHKDDGAVLQGMSLGKATPSSDAVAPFPVLLAWKVRRKRDVGRRRPAVGHIMCS